MLSERPWRLDLVLRFGIWLLVFNFAAGTLVRAWLASKYIPLNLKPESVTILVGTICFHGVALILICWLVRAHQLTFSAAFGFAQSRLGRALGFGIGGALLAMPVVLALGYGWGKLLTLLHVQVESQLPVQMLQESTSLQVRVLIGVVAIFIAPVVEEMLFRGILYAALKRYGFRRTALWATALVFAGVHLNLATFAPLIVLAIILSWLYEATDNLLAPIVAHSCFNLVNFFLLSPWVFDGAAPVP